MKEKLQQFMLGRYGADSLSRFLAGLSLVLLIMSMVFRSNFLILAVILTIILNYFRMFSKNRDKRYQENIKFTALLQSVRQYAAIRRSYILTRKTHHIYRCPNCRQKIRIPKGKGKISITCPSCKNEFIKRS